MGENIYDWSTTALTNGSADASINFAEGQLPSTVNNSARAVMAAHARFLKDNNGTLTTGGSANAYTLSVNGTYASLATGRLVSFKASFSNSGACTLNVTPSGSTALGAKAIRKYNGSGDSALVSGNIIQDGHYILRYDAAANAAAGAWIILNPILLSSDITGAALTKTDDTNVTLTLGGTPTGSLLQAVSIAVGWTGQTSLTRGGTAASLTASTGGILYSTVSALAILAGTATARQMLQSGASAAPAWSTTTWPATTTVNRILYSSSANVIGEITTGNDGVLITSAGGVPSISSTIPSATQDNITRTGTLVSGATGAGFTIALGTSTLTGDLPFANLTQVTARSVLGVTGNSTADAASIQGAAGQILAVPNAGTSLAFTATPQLGVAGTLGSLTFGNATSGLLTLQAVTGALGTVTVSLPAATDTLVGKATTDTLTNKTFDTAGTGNSLSINGVAVTANTGTGAVARAAGPTFTTPALGVATATSINGNTFTTGTYTLTGVAAKTLTFNKTLTLDGTDSTTMTFPPASANIGYLELPQNSKSAAYTTVLADSGKHILHPSADTTARIFTIDSNANVAYAVGTVLTFVNQNSGGVITISITSDTMRLAGAGTTGSRTLAANGIATAIKVTTTEWLISGTGLT